MKCKLIYFRLVAELLAILFFAISGFICLSAYFDLQNLQENERIILLISGIVHLVLFVLAFLSYSNTTTILGPYIFEDYRLYNEMMELFGLDKQSIHFIDEVENDVRSDKVYSEPSDDQNDTTENSRDNEVEPEEATKPQHLFGFTYKPGQNVSEELTYKEEFVAKLSSKVDFETFELGEDGYPPIFDIVIQSSEKEKRSKSAAEFVPKIPNFLFTYKPNEWSQNLENLKYTDKSVDKLSSNIELEDIVLKDQAVIEDILYFHLE